MSMKLGLAKNAAVAVVAGTATEAASAGTISADSVATATKRRFINGARRLFREPLVQRLPFSRSHAQNSLYLLTVARFALSHALCVAENSLLAPTNPDGCATTLLRVAGHAQLCSRGPR